MWLPDGTATVHPLTVQEGGTLAADTSRTAEVRQLRPDLREPFLAWTGGTEMLVNGGPAVLLPGSGRVPARLVGLGDFAVREGDRLTAEPADGFWARWVVVDP